MCRWIISVCRWIILVHRWITRAHVCAHTCATSHVWCVRACTCVFVRVVCKHADIIARARVGACMACARMRACVCVCVHAHTHVHARRASVKHGHNPARENPASPCIALFSQRHCTILCARFSRPVREISRQCARDFPSDPVGSF